MKILCISDNVDPLVYSPQIKERFTDVDLILSAGDLPMDYLDYIISSLNKPLYFVFGNHHTEELKHYRKLWNAPFVDINNEYLGCGAVHLGTRVKRTDNNLIVAGFGGCIRYNNGMNQFSEFQMFIEMLRIIPRLFWNKIVHGRFIDLLLTHAPPRGIHDGKDRCHRGFKTFLWFMKIFKPQYLVHGHIHLYDLSDTRCTKWNNTTVVNAYSHFVFNFGE